MTPVRSCKHRNKNPGRKVCAVHKEKGCRQDGDSSEDDDNKSGVLAACCSYNPGSKSGDQDVLISIFRRSHLLRRHPLPPQLSTRSRHFSFPRSAFEVAAVAHVTPVRSNDAGHPALPAHRIFVFHPGRGAVVFSVD